MLGLHNILLIAPTIPSSSSTSSFHHQPLIPFNNIDHFNTLNNNHHHPQEASFFAKRNALTITEDNTTTTTTTTNNNNSNYYPDVNRIVNNISSCRSCRDCGNRAKKECEFRRCRTCCKNRGYNCSTHVKSTWVPISRRRDKQGSGIGGGGGGSSSGSSSGGVKRRRENMASLSTAFGLDNGSCYQDASFKQSLPGQVCAPAVFRCLSVTTINDCNAEIAYQAMVKISGHVFKGFLYDQGIDKNNTFPKLNSSTAIGKHRDSTSPVIDPLNPDQAAGD